MFCASPRTYFVRVWVVHNKLEIRRSAAVEYDFDRSHVVFSEQITRRRRARAGYRGNRERARLKNLALQA